MRKGEYGFVQIKKTAGVASGANFMAVGDTVTIPVQGIALFNPLNKSYDRPMNVSAFLSQLTQGKRSPGAQLVASMKQTWHTHRLINSLVLSFDTSDRWNSDTFTLNISDGTVARQFQGVKCAQVATAFRAGGNLAIPMTFSFVGIRAEGDVSAPDAFGAATTDAGRALGPPDWDTGSPETATLTREGSISLNRIQIPDYVGDGTYFARKVESRGFFGEVTILQDPDAGTIPTTALTFRFGQTGSGVAYAVTVDADNPQTPLDPVTVINDIRRFTLFASNGGSNIAVSSF